ncbi:MAG TPA: Crp/Fnr family transcriptional regulator [Polyangia bacterium]|nr:Crp/Fnr family transcriptional regulator [Polyangia bacterium]
MGDDAGTRIERDFLANVPILGGLPEHVLGRVADLARVLRLPPGGEAFAEGDPARGMYVVREGELEIVKRGRTGAEFCLAVLKPGDCVGEMSLIDIQNRSATARATVTSALYVLDQTVIAALYHTELEVYTLFMLNIAREISRRLRCADQLLVDMGVAVHGMAPGARLTI